MNGWCQIQGLKNPAGAMRRTILSWLRSLRPIKAESCFLYGEFPDFLLHQT